MYQRSLVCSAACLQAAHANSAMVANVDNTRTDRAGSVSPDQVLRSSAQKNNR